MTAKRRVQLVCEICGASYERRYCERQSRYCSKACWSRRNPPSVKQCGYCGKDFTTHDRRARYCSRRCAGKDRTGPLAGAWKDGKSLERERARLSPKLKEWRIAVFIRDSHTCQKCRSTKNLHAHHIKPWAEYPDLRFEVANGETVCEKCHGEIHGKDFSNRRTRACVECGAAISGTGKTKRCRSCASKQQHIRQGHKKPRPCLHCGEMFSARNDYKYCSDECRKAIATNHHERECTQCGKAILVANYIIQRGVQPFCSQECVHSYQRTSVEVVCPVCHQLFTVKPYRIEGGKIVTCSRACKGKLLSQKYAQRVHSEDLQLPLF